jgi:ribonucleoside-diphosphate reductase beta chain
MHLTWDQADSKYAELFTKSKRLFWDPAAVDLSRDREGWAAIRRDHPAARYGEQIERLCSLFYQGEASVTRTLAPYLVATSRLELGADVEMYLTSQLYEEAKHFDFFSRYFREVLGDDGRSTTAHLTSAPQQLLVSGLEQIADRLVRADAGPALEAAMVEAVAYYMGVVEAMVARTGYQAVTDALVSRGWLPGLVAGFRLIRRDEGRHVAFGIEFLRQAVAARPGHRDAVHRVFENALPLVIEVVHGFDYPQPIVDLNRLTQYALDSSAQFLRAIDSAPAERDALVSQIEES